MALISYHARPVGNIGDRYYRAQVAYQLRAKLLRLRKKSCGIYSRKDRSSLPLASPNGRSMRASIRPTPSSASVPGLSQAARPARGQGQGEGVDAHALLGPYLCQIAEVIRIVAHLSRRQEPENG